MKIKEVLKKRIKILWVILICIILLVMCAFSYQAEAGTNDSTLLSNTRKEVAAHAFSWQRALKARKDFVMNHPKKIEIAELILSYRPEAKAITFNSSISQAEKFKNGFIVHSGNTKKKNRISLE